LFVYFFNSFVCSAVSLCTPAMQTITLNQPDKERPTLSSAFSVPLFYRDKYVFKPQILGSVAFFRKHFSGFWKVRREKQL